MSQPETLFDADFMERLEYLKVMATRMLPSRHRGEHRARKRGAGIELADYRPYVDGDDTRDVDWKAFLRLDKLVLRVFDEEADLPIYLFVDRSASMAFGDPPKFDFARRMAGALSYIGLMNHDLISIVWYGPKIEGWMAPKRGRNQIFRAFRFLDAGETGGATSLSACFRAFFGSRRKRGLAVVLSDLMDDENLLGAFDACRHQKHDMFVIQTLSPQELDPALPDEALLTDSEDGSERRVRVTPRLLGRYRQALGECARRSAPTAPLRVRLFGRGHRPALRGRGHGHLPAGPLHPLTGGEPDGLRRRSAADRARRPADRRRDLPPLLGAARAAAGGRSLEPHLAAGPRRTAAPGRTSSAGSFRC